MKMQDNNEDLKNGKIGRAIFSVSYFIYALSVIIPVTLISGIILYVISRPLWLAPVIGVGVWLLIRGVRRLIFRFFYGLSR